MRVKLVLTFLAGLVVGLVAVGFTGQQPQALAQRPEKPLQWEYKAVTFPILPKDATKLLNQLADDRWEYVGLVNTSIGGPFPSPNHEATVAFRRPKK